MTGGGSDVLFLAEPTLAFGYGQAVEDPRDGLTLFGPLDDGKPYGVRVGVIGTAQGIGYYRDWASRIQHPLEDDGSPVARPPFPGFEAAFGVPWAITPALVLTIPDVEIHQAVHLDDRHQRVHATVGVYSERILSALREQETAVDLWYVVIPDIVYTYCRPLSIVPKVAQIKAPTRLSPRLGRRLRVEPSLFAVDNEIAPAYEYDVDFHNQLKARLLERRALTQVVRESTIAPVTGIAERDRPARDTRKFQARIAWNLATAGFYKTGGRPWKIANVRDGVCYLGLVFKQDEKQRDPRSACCAAQMFLDSGDGVVFRGAVGPWYAPDTGDYHLSRSAARELASMALSSYSANAGRPPRELFIHGRVHFGEDEWRGFLDAADTSVTSVVGVRIRNEAAFRLFRTASHPVLRGITYIRNPTAAYLWTRGLVPRLRTYVGREVPRALRVEVVRGRADIVTVLNDLMALTKLNYNSCMFADGMPVTLRFADAVGEILTAGPVPADVPLPFKHYI